MEAYLDQISISRFQRTDGTSGINIRIEDAKYKVIYEGEMSIEDFALAVTGQCYKRCKRKYMVEERQ